MRFSPAQALSKRVQTKKHPGRTGVHKSENQHLRPVELVSSIISTSDGQVFFSPFISQFMHFLLFRHKNSRSPILSSGWKENPLFLPIIGMCAMFAEVVFI